MRWISKSLVVKLATVFRVFKVEYFLQESSCYDRTDLQLVL
jgi:hypothetical protein